MMLRFFRRSAAALLLLLWLPAGALALTGQTVSTFLTYYKDNIAYLNEIENRHMLPKELNELDLDDSGRTQYYYYDDTLHVTIATNAAGIIESCEIRLLYPENAVEGNSLYLDFIAANYHTLAFVMAMHVSAEAESRFLLVNEIAAKLEENHGAYDRQLGSYSISCISVVGEGAVFLFTNNGLTPAETAEPDGVTPDGQEPAEIFEDEEANFG